MMNIYHTRTSTMYQSSVCMCGFLQFRIQSSFAHSIDSSPPCVLMDSKDEMNSALSNSSVRPDKCRQYITKSTKHFFSGFSSNPLPAPKSLVVNYQPKYHLLHLYSLFQGIKHIQSFVQTNEAHNTRATHTQYYCAQMDCAICIQ